MAEPIPSNTPEFTVGELAGAIKRALEDGFGTVRLRGEISGYRGPHSSGHCYFSIKDSTAKIDAVIWKGVFARMRIKPEEGMEVVAGGKITTFPGKSNYQIVVESIEPAGVGALLALLEARRKALAAEGLFDAARKRALPKLPRVIGIVTSPTGAVIRDILHRLAERFPLRVIVWPVRVQGEGSAKEVAAAIDGFNALTPGGKIPRPDLLIVARGGGSLEDLWGFNEEIVVRAAAASQIPLISAVGHETDTTLIDFAADVRAPTPTAAAEIATPLRSQMLADLAALGQRARVAHSGLMERRRADWRGLARAMPSAEQLLAIPRQRLDRAEAALRGAARSGVAHRAKRLAEAFGRLARQSPFAAFARAKERQTALGQRLRRAFAAGLDKMRDTILQRGLDLTRAAARGGDQRRQGFERLALRLGAAGKRTQASRLEARRALIATVRRLDTAFARGLDMRKAKLAAVSQIFAAVNYRSVLGRGFALVRDEAGNPLRLSAEIVADQMLRLEFADGEIGARAIGGATPAPAKPKAKKRAEGQGSLF